MEDFKRDYAPRELPKLPDDLGGELREVVMMRLMEEQANKKAKAEAQAELQAELEKAQAETDTKLRTERIELIFSILKHRYDDAVPIDAWQPIVDQCPLDDLKTLVNEPLVTTSLEAFQAQLNVLSTKSEYSEA